MQRGKNEMRGNPRNRRARTGLKEMKQTPSIDELVAEITPENRHPEVDWGRPAGREKEAWTVATAQRLRRRP